MSRDHRTRTIPARVCTCEVTADNRINSASCPRHDVANDDGLLRDVAWDVLSGGNLNLTERR